jgi:membrane protein implicated in regulation of membrane protease activity
MEMQWLDFWHWWLLGVALLTLEMFAPGVFFLWMGVASGLVGALVLLQPDLLWHWQVLMFAVFSVALIMMGRFWFKRHPIQSDQPNLNRRGEQYVKRVFTLSEAIVNGEGKVQVDDSTWKVQGPDCPVGTRIRVSGVDGVILIVEPVEFRPGQQGAGPG